MILGSLFFEGFHLGSEHEGSETISEFSASEKPSVEVVNRDDAVEKHAVSMAWPHFGILAMQGHFRLLKEEIEENPRLSLERLGLDSTDMKSSLHWELFGWCPDEGRRDSRRT